jgi:hypothetical protein
LRPGCGLPLVAFHGARYAHREAGRNFLAQCAGALLPSPTVDGVRAQRLGDEAIRLEDL